MQEFKVTKRIKGIALICFIIFLSIILKLGYSQLISYKSLSKLATDQFERSFPLTSSRGLIKDKYGTAIALNLPVTSIAVIPFQIENKEDTANKLASVLNADKDIILSKISKKESMVKLSKEGRKIDENLAKKVKDLNLKGVYLIQDNERYYPYDELLSSTIGFCGIDNQGLAGIESYYDYLLKGKNGTLNYKMDAKGGLFSSLESNIVSPVSGFNINLTIDLNIQQILERELTNAYNKYKPESIYAIAMDPNNGEILALSNRPNYDPNNYQNYNQEIYNRNLPVWKSFEPGSAFKVFTFAAALEEKCFDMYKDTYYDKGFEVVSGRTIKSWKKGGHGLQTFLEVLENSSNPGFVEISRRLGVDKLYDYIKLFGFSKKTNVDIVGESTGIFFKKDNYHELENATCSFGQGISVTAIQLISAFCSVINGGLLYQPYITKSIEIPSTNEILVERSPSITRRVISEETSLLMRKALESVVANATGRNAYIDGYRVGGKTATAQIAENGVYLDNQYILSFIGAAPMNDPKIAVYIAMEKPHSTIQYGGTVVAPIVRNVLKDVLPLLKIDTTNEGLKKEYTWLDTKSYELINYVGLDKKMVKSNTFKFEFIGEGNIVADQIPKAGSFLQEGSKVVIILKEKENEIS